MSDAVLIALISNAFTLLTIVVSRLLSHLEHKQTSADVREIKKAINGGFTK